ncbi:hypothetical protein Glove_132g232 [Diversispora epigaea]|uniref:Protein kinase domain-containing protein n=1 Tax=Diversispora epigaea TaxID=1348612 RepID=A0A397IXF4_9GLOM|nr:hypothetical protein Glove_132g232 [Diversispora epigaea]
MNPLWCKPCNSKHFLNDFNNWTSRNDNIDKLIQDAQLNAHNDSEVIEWIPFKRFKDVKQIGKGRFGTIHYARWIDGQIYKWNIENQQWERYRRREEVEVALKKFDNFVNFDDILNETEIHLRDLMLQFNSQDPETHKYVMDIKISDFRLSKLKGVNPNNPEKKNIVGVLPYIVLEMLSGDEEYTKAADNHYEVLGCSNSEIRIQIENSEKLSKNLGLINSTTPIPLNYQTHPQAIYTSRLNFSKLLKPKNEENFERELEESTKSTSALSIVT